MLPHGRGNLKRLGSPRPRLFTPIRQQWRAVTSTIAVRSNHDEPGLAEPIRLHGGCSRTSTSRNFRCRVPINKVFRQAVDEAFMAQASGIVGEFQSLKAEVDADLLAMQCGDFYEFFGEDAQIVGRELDLKVSSKSSGGKQYPMAGVPVDELTPYLRALIERGFRVAVADQYETENGHSRAIERVVTPGTFVETTEPAAFLAAIVHPEPQVFGLAFADVTTGRCMVARIAGENAAERVLTECYRIDPVELLPGPGIRTYDLIERIAERTGAMITNHTEDAFAPQRAKALTRDHYGPDVLTSLGLETTELASIRAVGALLDYIDEAGVGVLSAMTRLQPYDDGETVALDVTTQRNLELIEPMLGDGVSLLSVLDRTVTAAGSRRLREWISRPITDRQELAGRLDRIEALAESPLARDAVRGRLGDGADLERLTSRLSRSSADARTLRAVEDTLNDIPTVVSMIRDDPRLNDSPIAEEIDELPLATIESLSAELEAAVAREPPAGITEGGLFRRGYDPELDDLIERHERAKQWIDELAEREREAHGITHLQVGRNRTDGYYIQVGNSETGDVPPSYREIKSLKNSTRYTTDELDDHERDILRLEQARYDFEYELFVELRKHVADSAETLQVAGRFLARLDVFVGLATHAVDVGWARPTLEERGSSIEIEGGRHPVVEAATTFVPNHTQLDENAHIVLLTGPNMSGKSTYLRQTALIVLLAQIGSFVPAERARIGIVDGIFSRVGAMDELSTGRSTFMVEMQELANILHASTEESLVILDEVGRGTATYDGISIAWAATEYLHNEVGAKTLFATHYHELTELAEHLPGAVNRHVSVDERDGEITFLRTVAEGPANRSYGIYVAELAGVPSPVRDRAREVLDRLRTDRAVEARGGSSVQAVFDLGAGEMRATANPDGDREPLTERILDELAALPIEERSPLEVATRVAEWQERLSEE